MKYCQAIGISLLIAGTLAAYEDCKSCYIQYEDDDGKWGFNDGEWCLINEKKCNELKSSGECY